MKWINSLELHYGKKRGCLIEDDKYHKAIGDIMLTPKDFEFIFEALDALEYGKFAGEKLSEIMILGLVPEDRRDEVKQELLIRENELKAEKRELKERIIRVKTKLFDLRDYLQKVESESLVDDWESVLGKGKD